MRYNTYRRSPAIPVHVCVCVCVGGEARERATGCRRGRRGGKRRRWRSTKGGIKGGEGEKWRRWCTAKSRGETIVRRCINEQRCYWRGIGSSALEKTEWTKGKKPAEEKTQPVNMHVSDWTRHCWTYGPWMLKIKNIEKPWIDDSFFFICTFILFSLEANLTSGSFRTKGDVDTAESFRAQTLVLDSSLLELGLRQAGRSSKI